MAHVTVDQCATGDCLTGDCLTTAMQYVHCCFQYRHVLGVIIIASASGFSSEFTVTHICGVLSHAIADDCKTLQSVGSAEYVLASPHEIFRWPSMIHQV